VADRVDHWDDRGRGRTPGRDRSTEDQVYYVVNRTINGATVRYLEKWAKETDCRGGTLNKQADAFIIFTKRFS